MKTMSSTTAKILLEASILLLAACGREPAGEAGAAPEAVVRARLALVEKARMAGSVELPGTVEADRTADVSSRVMALVTAVRVHVGDPVRRGQVLVEIDPQTTAGQLGQAQGGLAQAQAALALAERNYERFKALASTGAASELELDMARTQYEQARGAVAQARGAVAAASSVANESRVAAPFDGRVVMKMAEVGDLAAPGKPLLRIESAGAHRLAVPVPESLFATLRPKQGDRIEVAVDARPELGRFPGKVVEVAPSADPMAHAVMVKIDLGGVDVPAGAWGRAYIPGSAREVVAVPVGAVLRQGGASLVVVRDEKGEAFSRVVTLGETLPEDRVEILSGLSGGETVLSGLTEVPPLGARVEEAGGAPSVRLAEDRKE
jgi:RND family efflux transporter MFP subunit